jgi:rRNA-processing protein EBP2
MFDVALDDQTADTPRRKKGDRSSDDKSKAKRAKKDYKYGFGGKKRHAKSNDAKSSGDLGEFSHTKNRTSFGGGKKKKAISRPGKSKRMAKR